LVIYDRISLDAFPENWKYYTLTFPVVRDKHLSLDGIIDEMIFCVGDFYFMLRILRGLLNNFYNGQCDIVFLFNRPPERF